MPLKNDNRHKEIGSKARARSRYAMLLHRTKNPTGKNSCYVGIEVRISKEDFMDWFMANDFPGCSVDRICADGHYEVGNLQLIPLPENIGKDKRNVLADEKKCTYCGEVKPINDFVKSAHTYTGKTSTCKPCEARRTKIRRATGSSAGLSSGR